MTSKPKSFNVLSFLKVWKKWDFWFFAENQKVQSITLYFHFYKIKFFQTMSPIFVFPMLLGGSSPNLNLPIGLATAG